MTRTSKMIVLLLLGSAAGCAARFPFESTTSNAQIFEKSVAALNEGREGLAIQGLERLRDVLPQRDSLRPKAIYHLGVAYARNKEYYKAALELRGLQAIYPTDSLADDALLLAAREYRKLWPHPELTKEYGEAAQQMLELLLQTYPDSPLREEVFREDADLQEQFATKLYEQAMDHFRAGRYPSANMGFREVLEAYPATARARQARFMIVRGLRKLGWQDEIQSECVVLRQMYRDDPEVREHCGGTPALSGGFS